MQHIGRLDELHEAGHDVDRQHQIGGASDQPSAFSRSAMPLSTKARLTVIPVSAVNCVDQRLDQFGLAVGIDIDLFGEGRAEAKKRAWQGRCSDMA